MTTRLALSCILILAVASSALGAASQVTVEDLSVDGRITGGNIVFTVALTMESDAAITTPLVTGDLVAMGEPVLPEGVGLALAEDGQGYLVHLPRPGRFPLRITFAARPRVLTDGLWREAGFGIPSSRRRELAIVGDRPDLEVLFPGALRQERSVVDEQVRMTAILGPGLPFAVRWKPQVADLAADLVFTTENNAIVTVNPGTLRLDDLITVAIAQGELQDLRLQVPPGVNIIRVDGPYIRDWRLEAVEPVPGTDKGEPASQILRVELNRQVRERYVLRVEAEQALPRFPCAVSVPSLAPVGGLRSHGTLAVGTDNAIQLVVAEARGCSQIDTKAFRIRSLAEQDQRQAPTGKVFAYTFPAPGYQLDLRLADIVPAYDVQQQIAVRVGEDDVVVQVDLGIDVRDAPIPELVVDLPTGWSVAAIAGAQVDGDDVQTIDGVEAQQLIIPFTTPVLGTTAIQVRLERGQAVLGTHWDLPRPVVRGARSQRGYLVLAAADGVRLSDFTPQELRRVHAASVPVAGAGQFAYRFREPTWSLRLAAARKASTIRAESFHLLGIGEGMCYGNVVLNYMITGAPIDRLQFRVDPRLRGVEFVGSDVTRATEVDGLWTVHLRRKVIGDYNLGVVFNHPLGDDLRLPIAAIATEGIDGETGWIVLASRRNVHLQEEVAQAGLVRIAPEELPDTYRLLVGAPVLRAWTYVAAPAPVDIPLEDATAGSTLAALVELLALETQLSIRQDGTVESRTHAAYQVKNAREQFIDIRLPAGARPWGSVHLVDGQGTRRRATVASDSEGTLKVQLPRTANPNDPVTIEVDYGQSHGPVAGSASVDLQAPLADLVCSYLTWNVHSHSGWSLEPRPGGMDVARQRQPPVTGLADVFDQWWRAWTSALGRAGDNLLLGLLAGVGLLAVVLTALLRRRWLLPVIAAVLLVALILVGVDASQHSAARQQLGEHAPVTTLSASRALETGTATPPVLSLAIVPESQRDAGPGVVLLTWLVALGAAAAAAWWRRWRLPLVATALAAGLVAASWHPTTRPWLLHVGTWVPGVVVAIVWLAVLLWHTWRPSFSGRVGLAAVALLALWGGGCGGGSRPVIQHSEVPVPDLVAVDLVEQEDAIAVDLRLVVRVDEPAELPILDPGAVLLEDPVQAGLAVRIRDGQHLLVFERAGRYETRLPFLVPKRTGPNEELGVVDLPLPRALRNQVRLTTRTAGQAIASPTAVHLLQHADAEGHSSAEAVLGPGEPIRFVWRPKAREIASETPVYYATVQALTRFDVGLVQGHHQVDYRIAQGQLQDLRLHIPAGMTVTAVQGEGIGTWRFSPEEGLLEVLLTRPVTDAYALDLVTQVQARDLPTTYELAPVVVQGSEHQRGSLGLSGSKAVHLTLGEGQVRLTAEDFARGAGRALAAADDPDLRYALRQMPDDAPVRVQVRAVQPELRSSEQASFSISDDRLVYNSQWQIDISKAGVFAVELLLPPGFDIDHLGSPSISHWDELTLDDGRLVTLHFANRTQGAVALRLALSTPVGEVPERIDVPRVQVVDSLKHRGRLVVSSERGMRLSVLRRDGLSEQHPDDAGVADDRSQVFAMLKPDWQLSFTTELVEPLIHVDALHIARVTDGLVRHAHHLRWRLQHAGTKTLVVALPRGLRPDRGLGLTVGGPDIADWRTRQAEGAWLVEVELTRKWFDAVYPMTIHYETRFSADSAGFTLRGLRPQGADLTRHFATVFASDRVELAVAAEHGTLTRADSRTVPDRFGVGDLSGAAFSYRTTDGDAAIDVAVTRHGVADLLAADVRRVGITTVLAVDGAQMTRVQLDILVGNKRHLGVSLPTGAVIWATTINGRPVKPAIDPTDPARHLLPLSQGAVEEVAMEVELVLVQPRPGDRSGRVHLLAPRFDLPLRQVGWTVYAPAGYRYDDFAGTMNHRQLPSTVPTVVTWDSEVYQREVAEEQQQLDHKAQAWAEQSKVYADSGNPHQARMALENAYNYSLGNGALNEDARVQLHSLNRLQALVCLVDRRGALRRQSGEATVDGGFGDSFSTADIDRVTSSLQKEDFDNLRAITERLVEAQHLAIAPAPQIAIQMPTRGTVLHFERALQVDGDQGLRVAFQQSPVAGQSGVRHLLAGASLAAALLILLGLLQATRAWWVPAPLQPGPALADPIVDQEPGADDPSESEIAAQPNDEDLLAGIPGIPDAREVQADLTVPEVGATEPPTDGPVARSDSDDGDPEDTDDFPAADEEDRPG